MLALLPKKTRLHVSIHLKESLCGSLEFDVISKKGIPAVIISSCMPDDQGQHSSLQFNVGKY